MSRLAFGAIALVALSALVAGCGGAKKPFYTPDQVRTAFAAGGIPLYDQFQIVDRRSRVPPHAPPTPAPEPVTRPLTALLNGVRAAVMGPTTPGSTRATTLRGYQLDVFVYPRDRDARRRVAALADLLAAQQILRRVGFGFERRGNVVVTYRLYQYELGVPGFLGDRDRVRKYDGRVTGSVAAALGRLP
jgi:hypothetical protein